VSQHLAQQEHGALHAGQVLQHGNEGKSYVFATQQYRCGIFVFRQFAVRHRFQPHGARHWLAEFGCGSKGRGAIA
ncbi:hypothetical protein, partial [Providencia rettgeri]|uniref:hypothetical protein n=1 Tax=Providencia rettgeri TaxID=587 RepID=UPI0029D89361